MDTGTPTYRDALEILYKGWADYQALLLPCIAPLTTEQLALRVSPNLRSIGGVVRHMIGGRARWMHYVLQEGPPELVELATWDSKGKPERSGAELAGALQTTWAALRAATARWTPAEYATPFTFTDEDGTMTVTRAWVIWHLIEHDAHHGGEVSFSLGAHSLSAPDL